MKNQYEYKVISLQHNYLMNKNTTDLSSDNVFYKQNILPKHLTKLSTPRTFDGPIMIPKYLYYLLLGEFFNHSIVLPKHLKKLFATYAFNKPIIITKSITHYRMGYYFNQPVLISKKTRELMFGREFNKPILLSKNIKKLCVSVMYVGKLNVENLDLLIIDAVANYYIVENIPNTVKNVIFGDFMNLPLNNLSCETNVEIQNIYYKHKITHRKMSKITCSEICKW